MKGLFFLLLLLGITAKVSAQLVNNGGFESQDGIAPVGSEYFSIEFASYWHNLTGSCDLVPLITGATRTGVGAGRLGVASNGWTEFCYGSTQPLIAGHVYQVSFWIRKDYEPTNGTDLTYGLAISENLPVITTSPLTTSVPPLMKIKVETTQYVKATACFTPQSSVAHFITIGPFGGNGTPEDVLHLIDDVEVIDVTNQPLPTASISLPQTVYCVGDNVILDGTASTNETEHQWKIYVNGTQEIYNSGMITGTAGTFNASNHLTFLQPGVCYRAELTVYGFCKDVTTVDFCFANPNIDFIFDGNPVCENTPVDLQVTGDNGWTYTWKQGNDSLSSGVGLKTLTVTPTMGNGVFTVTVTTLEGCTHTETIHLNVNTHDNVAPWMDGINGTGEYTYYVSQGDAVFFNSVLSNDYSNELIEVSGNYTIPNGFVFSHPDHWGDIFSLSWATSLSTPTGEYHYYLTADDKNACGAGISAFDFKIIVICDQCKVCVGFEDRTPSGTPLPPETKAGRCIQAGFSQTVSTGTADVVFQAGVEIEGGPYFDAGPGYEAIIDPTTCVTDCEDCCTDWNGFTYDELPNPFFMNFGDSDPTNDFIQVTDINHPFCAFSAQGYKFEVLDNHSNLMNNVFPYEDHAASCCKYKSPAPENPIAHSPIWWNGFTQDPVFGTTSLAHSQAYTYKLTLYGCNGEELLVHGVIELFRDNNGMTQNPNGEGTSNLSDDLLNAEQKKQLEEARIAREKLDKSLDLFPNPTTGIVQVSGLESEDIHYQVFDDKGLMLSRKEKMINNSFSLTNYSKGTYYIRIYSGTSYAVRKVIKM